MVGIDPSEAYLQGARDSRSHPSITYERGDICHMHFADRSFDAVGRGRGQLPRAVTGGAKAELIEVDTFPT